MSRETERSRAPVRMSVPTDRHRERMESSVRSAWDNTTVITLSFLDWRDIVSVAAFVSHQYHRASRSPLVWNLQCRDYWAGRYVGETVRKQAKHGDALAAFKHSVLYDSKRTCMTAMELCGSIWSHRMKGRKGLRFKADPWWNGKRATRIQYYADGENKIQDTLYPCTHT